MLNLDYLNLQHKTLIFLGKGDQFRLIKPKPKNSKLLQLYIAKHPNNLSVDPKIEELLQLENKEDIMKWLDSL